MCIYLFFFLFSEDWRCKSTNQPTSYHPYNRHFKNDTKKRFDDFYTSGNSYRLYTKSQVTIPLDINSERAKCMRPDTAVHRLNVPCKECQGNANCSDELDNVQCHLEIRELWERFHELGTEMIITKSGRFVKIPLFSIYILQYLRSYIEN